MKQRHEQNKKTKQWARQLQRGHAGPSSYFEAIMRQFVWMLELMFRFGMIRGKTDESGEVGTLGNMLPFLLAFAGVAFMLMSLPVAAAALGIASIFATLLKG